MIKTIKTALTGEERELVFPNLTAHWKMLNPDTEGFPMTVDVYKRNGAIEYDVLKFISLLKEDGSLLVKHAPDIWYVGNTEIKNIQSYVVIESKLQQHTMALLSLSWEKSEGMESWLDGLDDIEDETKKYKDKEISTTYGGLKIISPMLLIEDTVISQNKEFVQQILTLLQSCIIKSDVTLTNIKMLAADSNGYKLTNYNLKDKFSDINNKDLYYGEGFSEWHEKLLSRLTQDNKGLVLLHGEPGTGKTTYIRNLLSKLTEVKKDILYIPPAIAESLTDPAIIDFIQGEVRSSENGYIILIEDAEPLLVSREDDYNTRTTGITNLLNITDGLLNDILNIAVICTFNTDIKSIDSALLRPGRLLARKQFGPVSIENGKKIAELHGIDPTTITKEMTVSDIINSKEDLTILEHGVRPKKQKNKPVGF